jgi:riboflavin synthase
MFSGIIEEIGSVSAAAPAGAGRRLEIAARLAAACSIGGSISVNGVCLTVERKTEKMFAASLSPQTMQETTLGKIRTGAAVNLEQALRMGDRIGGHFLSGHVDFQAPLITAGRRGDSLRWQVRLPRAALRLVVPRGSIGLDGVSLTVAEISADLIELWLVPHTLAVTTLGARRAGDSLNVELDMLGKYAQQALQGNTEDYG